MPRKGTSAAPDPRRLQGIPRVKWAQDPPTANLDDASDAIFLASGYGMIPDPWQVDIINCWMMRNRAGKWIHKTNGLAVPRQNGKNGTIEVRELFGLIVLGEYILHTAHELKTSRKAFKRLKSFFGERRDDPEAKHPDLNALVAEVRNTNGQEAIVLKDLWSVDGELVRSIGRPDGAEVEFVARGGLIEFSTRTGGGGRGTTYDLLIIDEAQHLAEEDLAAVRPVISSGALGNSQIIYLGTPPDPDKLGDGFGQAFVRIRSNAGKTKTQSWIEYGAPDGPLPDLEDMELLYSANPSLDVKHGNGSHGLDFEVIEGERTEMDPEDYARERLGWWGEQVSAAALSPIHVPSWKTSTDEDPGHSPEKMACFAVEVDIDRAWASVGAAGLREDGRIQLEVVDRRRGIDWIVARCVELNRSHGPIPFVIDGGGPAYTLVKALKEAGLSVIVAGGADVAKACATLVDAVLQMQIAHGPDDDLQAAVEGCRTRKFRDGGFVFGRVASSVDVTPLMAVTLAWWGVIELPGAPEVWDLNDIVAQLLKERAGLEQPADTEPDREPTSPPGVTVRPDGVRFVTM